MISARGARQSYLISKHKQRNESKKKEQDEKLTVQNQGLHDVQQRRQQLIEVSNAFDDEFTKTIKQTEKQRDVRSISALIIKRNRLKSKSEEKRIEQVIRDNHCDRSKKEKALLVL